MEHQLTSRITQHPHGLPLLLVIAGAIAFLPLLGHAQLFDWDELNFAEISREMVVLDDYVRVHVNFQPFYEKPPLFFWLQAMSMQIFGVGAFAARLPNALCGIATLLVVYSTGKSLYDQQFGLLWALAFAGSILPNFYFHTGLIDPWFNLLIFVAIAYSVRAVHDATSTWRRSAVAGIALGLAILAKGPVAWLIIFLCGCVLALRHLPLLRKYLRCGAVVTGTALVTSLTWFGIETVINGPEFVIEFIRYQAELLTSPVAGHRGFPGYHLVVTLIGCFPASIIALPSLFRHGTEGGHRQYFRRWMIALLCVVLILFTLVQSKIVHYSSLAYFPITFFATRTIWHAMHSGKPVPRWSVFTLAGFALVIGSVLIAVPFLANNLQVLQTYVQDPFAQANLEAEVSWPWPHLAVGLSFMALMTYAVIQLAQQRIRSGVVAMYLAVVITMSVLSTRWLSKVLHYTQGAAVEFYTELAEQDCYITTLGFKSYAHYYYARVSPEAKVSDAWLLDGEPDKPAYFVSRLPRATTFDGHPNLEKLYERNGYVFFRRRSSDE